MFCTPLGIRLGKPTVYRYAAASLPLESPALLPALQPALFALASCPILFRLPPSLQFNSHSLRRDKNANKPVSEMPTYQALSEFAKTEGRFGDNFRMADQPLISDARKSMRRLAASGFEKPQGPQQPRGTLGYNGPASGWRYIKDSRQIRQFPDGCDYLKRVFCRGNGDFGQDVTPPRR